MDTKIQERINLFKIVRDIPYNISVGEEQDFSCSTKAEILEKLLYSIGLKSRHKICEFRWEDLNLPKEVLKFSHEGIECHQFLEVYTPENQKYVIVDPTWDSKLRKIFVINEWDGLNNTKIAVPTKKIYLPEESLKLIRKFNKPKEIESYIQKNRSFLIELNNYLKRVRNNFT